MINKIFWDLDETLIHTHNYSDIGHDFIMTFDNGGWSDPDIYKVKVHPAALNVLKFSRSIVGADKVFILTSATTDYAREVNSKAGFGFRDDQIIAREDISRLLKELPTEYDDENNVLIDNLPAKYNEDKLMVIGIGHSNYLEIDDYHGTVFPGSNFEQKVKDFLNEQNAE